MRSSFFTPQVGGKSQGLCEVDEARLRVAHIDLADLSVIEPVLFGANRTCPGRIRRELRSEQT
jgi:hypothetical protein